jgi:hypothetical protein
VKDRGPLKNLIFGDYRLQMGQGLVYGSGYAPGKGRETLLAVRRNGLNLRPIIPSEKPAFSEVS